MADYSSRRLGRRLLGAVLASVALTAWADPPMVGGSNSSPWQDGIHGGSYDFKMSAGTSKLYSFGMTPRGLTFNYDLLLKTFGGTGPRYIDQPVTNYVFDGTTYVPKTSNKLGGKTLLYIHGSSVYFINPEAPFHNSNDAVNLEKSNFSKKLPLSTFTGLDTASFVHMNLSGLVWLNGTNLYAGGNARDTGSGASQLIATNVVEAKSFGPFAFFRDSGGSVYFVGSAGQNQVVQIAGPTDLSFLSDPAHAYMVEGDTVQLAGLGVSGLNYKFKYTDQYISAGTVEAVVAGTADPITPALTTFYANAYANGKPSYRGQNSPGAWVVNDAGVASFTADVYGTPDGGNPRNYEYTCVDTLGWQVKNTIFNNLSLLYAPTSAVAYTHLGGYGDLSVGMLADGTLKFAGSNSSSRVMANNPANGRNVINGWGYPYSNTAMGFCNPVSLPLDDADGPTNVVATKALFNDKVRVTWDSKGPGSKYTVRRRYLDSDVLIATDVTNNSLDDFNTYGGDKKEAPVAYSVSANTATPIYKTRAGDIYFDQGNSFTGCDLSSNLTHACVGFKANAPTSANSNLSAVVATDLAAQVIPTTGFSVNDPDNPYDSFTYALLGGASHGTVSTNPSGQFVYTPSVGYIGSDTFTVNATDKAGNSIPLPVNLDVRCSNPTIKSVTLPTTFNSFISQLGSVQFDANACNQTVGITATVTLRNSTAVIAAYDQTFTGVATGTNQSKGFFLNNMPAGDYTLHVDMASERSELAATNKASRTFDFKVNPVGTYSLTLSKPMWSEDELIPVNVTASSGSCPIMSQSVARYSGACYVEWTGHPFYQTTSSGDSNLSGYAEAGLLQQVTAKIHKYDTNFVSHFVTSLAQDINVTLGIPTSLKPIAVPASITRQLDNVNFVFERDSGFACTIYTNPSSAEVAVNAGGKACLLEATLPPGLTWQTGTTWPTASGRIAAPAGTYPLPYTLSKYYVGKPAALMDSGSLSLHVVDPALVFDVQSNKPAFVVNASNASVEAKINAATAGGKTCTPSTSQAAAAASYTSTSALTCYVAWDTIPAGLSVDTTVGTVPKLKGVPTTMGNNPIKFTAYTARTAPGGSVTTDVLGSYEGTLTVTDMTPLNFTLPTPKEGLITLSGDPVLHPLVGDAGEIGELQIVAGDFSTIKMIVQETGFAPQVFTGLRNGDKRAISISGGTKGAWINRSATIKLEYEEVAVATQVAGTLDLVQLPAQKMAIQIAQPSISPNDTAPFSFTAKMGVVGTSGITYNAATGGVWNAALYTKQGTIMVPITTESTVQSNGNVTWDNLQFGDFAGVEFYARARWIPPTGSTLNIPDKVITSDKGVTLNFVHGGALNAETIIGRAKGGVPLKQTFDLRLATADVAALKSVVWYISNDNVTYTPLGVSGRAASFTFNTGGVYYVKGQMTNKFTNLVSFSDPVSFTVNQVYKIAFVGDDLVMPGSNVSAEINIKNNDDTPANIADLDVVWDVTNSQGVDSTFNDVTSIPLQSAVPTVYTLNVRVKGKTMDASNADSWYQVQKKITFFTPTEPRITITGPRVVEVGSTGNFKVTVRPPWDVTAKTSLTLKGKWTLPDGVTEVPDAAQLDHLVLAADGPQQTVKYTAWIDGMESTTSTSQTYKFATNTYVFPTFKLAVEVDSMFAPAFVRLGAVPDTTFDAQQMRGKKLTYTWSLPASNFIGTGNGYALRGIADQPGVYAFQVIVTDDRGNTQTLNYSLTLETTTPWVLSMKLNPGLKFNRAPMTFVVKPGITGGHPKDRIKESVLSINGVDQPIVQGFPKLLQIATAGTHTVGLRVLSNMGMTASTTETVVVNENVPPNCTLTESWDSARTVAKMTPKCSDGDGKIKKILWFIDGVQSTRSGTYLYVYPTPDKPSAEVKVQVWDDSGEFTEITNTVTK